MDEEIERMNEEIIELREDNQRLHNMCVIIEQINDILTPIVNECKCHLNTNQNSKIKTKLNILRHKYQQLKESENNFTIINNNIVNNKQTIIDKLKKCSQITPKLIIKKNINSDNNSNDLINDNIMKSEENIDNNIVSNNRQNYTISVEGFDETFYRENGEEVKLEFILPQVDNEVEIIDNSICNDNNLINNNKNDVKIKRNNSRAIKSRSKRVKKRDINDRDIVLDEKLIKKNKRTNKISCNWPGCELLFRDRYNLQVHMTRHTGEKSYQCVWPGCVKTYATKAALDVHYNTHSDNRRFKCIYSQCDAAFIRKTQLTVHISDKHTGNRQYKCDWPGCEYQSCYLNRLQAHKMRHTGEKPYKCNWPQCQWSFRLNHHLKTHMLKHTGEKPFVCDLSECDKRFQSKQAMKLHVEKVHMREDQ